MSKRKWSKKGVTQSNLKKVHESAGDKWTPVIVGYLNSDIKMFVPKEGENKIRIIQPLEVDDLGYYGREVHFHRGVGPMDHYYICLRRMRSQRCFICELQTSELWDEDPELAKTFYPDTRVLMWVLNLNSDDPDEPLLWSCAKSLAESILGQSHKKETEVYTDVSHPTEGVPVFFDRKGKGLKTKYQNVQLGEEQTELEESLLDEIDYFDNLIIWPEYDQVKAAYYGDEVEEDETSEHDDIPESVESSEEDQPDEDCFQKKFDEYEECDDCKWRDDCKPKKQKKEPKKQKKEAKKEKKEANKEKKEKKEAKKGKKSDGADKKKKSIKEKLKKQIADRKKKK